MCWPLMSSSGRHEVSASLLYSPRSVLRQWINYGKPIDLENGHQLPHPTSMRSPGEWTCLLQWVHMEIPQLQPCGDAATEQSITDLTRDPKPTPAPLSRPSIITTTVYLEAASVCADPACRRHKVALWKLVALHVSPSLRFMWSP
ncbi:hypothetical protein NLU13_0574 [Sarocladium strictum]|uniref:Uncharacterized protein n=1 Tax=Sarocladium strictum TaxID=5046 RepID=A0AA39GPB3_SARSR|nr:hypothetical protein NLU13_0574 [Sarocladium strictum]